MYRLIRIYDAQPNSVQDLVDILKEMASHLVIDGPLQNAQVFTEVLGAVDRVYLSYEFETLAEFEQARGQQKSAPSEAMKRFLQRRADFIVPGSGQTLVLKES